MWSLAVSCDQRFNRLFIEHRKDLDVTFCIFIADIQPELIEFIGRGITWIEPNVSRFSFAEFGTVSLFDQRTGQTISLSTQFTTDQFSTSGNISPLIRTTHLQFTVFVLIEMQEVGSLNQLIGKFGKRHTVTFAIEAFFDGVFRHHIIDSNTFADLADKLEERVIFHPIVVVDQFGCIGCIRFEIDKVAQLTFDSLLVMTQGLFVEKIAFE